MSLFPYNFNLTLIIDIFVSVPHIKPYKGLMCGNYLYVYHIGFFK